MLERGKIRWTGKKREKIRKEGGKCIFCVLHADMTAVSLSSYELEMCCVADCAHESIIYIFILYEHAVSIAPAAGREKDQDEGAFNRLRILTVGLNLQ